MRAGLVFLSLLIMGLHQAASAAAGRHVPARPAAPRPDPGPPVLATPNGQVMDQARELADADLAAAPGEEAGPVRIDADLLHGGSAPATPRAAVMAKAALVVPRRAAIRSVPPRPSTATAAAKRRKPVATADTALAETKPHKRALVLASAPVPSAAAVPHPAPTASTPALLADTTQSGAPPLAATEAAEQRAPRPDYALAERIVQTAGQGNGSDAPASTVVTVGAAARPIEPKPIEDAREPARVAVRVAEASPPPLPAVAEITEREEEPVAGSLSPEAEDGAESASQPAEDRREQQTERVPEPSDRDERTAESEAAPDTVPAMRDGLADAEPRGDEQEEPYRGERQRDDAPIPAYGERWAHRDDAPPCDGGRFDDLTRAVRRAAQVGAIDPRAADDMQDEIAHGEDMQQSYCATGMNDWRERRLDEQYAQIEDRLRYERGQ